MAEPKQKPGMSKQNYGTSREFLEIVEERFGQIVADLAAEESNAKCEIYISKEENSFNVNWSERFPNGNLWLNPPFAKISNWAEKCARESLNRDGKILMLIPASIGSNYYAEHIHQKSLVLALSPRLVFEGEKHPYPKDLILCVYSKNIEPGFNIWRWKK